MKRFAPISLITVFVLYFLANVAYFAASMSYILLFTPLGSFLTNLGTQSQRNKSKNPTYLRPACFSLRSLEKDVQLQHSVPSLPLVLSGTFWLSLLGRPELSENVEGASNCSFSSRNLNVFIRSVWRT